MKVFYCTADYNSGDHEQGYYKSPIFSKREDAEAFKNLIIERRKQGDMNLWWSDSWQGDEYLLSGDDIHIAEEDLFEGFDADLVSANDDPIITYT